MPACPCCGALSSDPAEAGTLCDLCALAMETGIDRGVDPSPTHSALPPTDSPTLDARSAQPPLGVTVIGLLSWVLAALFLSAAGIAAVKSAGDQSYQGINNGYASLLSLLTGVLLAFIGRGMFKLRSWARGLAIGLAAFYLVLDDSGWERLVLLAALLYLLSRGVRLVFRRPTAHSARASSHAAVTGSV